MKDTQHTPGPWIYAFNEGNMPFADIWTLDKHCTGPGHETEQRLHLATVYTDGADDANARLIAASPDTLERLETTTHMLENLVSDLKRLPFSSQALDNIRGVISANRAAIAKATGNP